MPRYVYIHGFNSGKGSRSGAALEKVIGAPVFCPVNDYSLSYQDCLDNLINQIADNCKNEKLSIMGTSLGAFYALQLRLPNTENVTGWNPVIFPAIQLARFVGKNTRFTDNQDWFFPKSSLLSYAAAPDPRQWNNFYQQKLTLEKHQAGLEEAPPRTVILGVHDELLDAELARVFWQDHARLMEIDSGHSIMDFEHAISILK